MSLRVDDGSIVAPLVPLEFVLDGQVEQRLAYRWTGFDLLLHVFVDTVENQRDTGDHTGTQHRRVALTPPLNLARLIRHRQRRRVSNRYSEQHAHTL